MSCLGRMRHPDNIYSKQVVTLSGSYSLMGPYTLSHLCHQGGAMLPGLAFVTALRLQATVCCKQTKVVTRMNQAVPACPEHTTRTFRICPSCKRKGSYLVTWTSAEISSLPQLEHYHQYRNEYIVLHFWRDRPENVGEVKQGQAPHKLPP